MAEEIQEAVQIIRVMYEGIEIAVKLGSGGLSAAQQIVNSLVGLLEHEKLHGKTNVRKLLQKGGDLQVFQFNEEDFKKVQKLLKKYGVLYSVLPDLKKEDGKMEILFHSEAVPRINAIAQKLVYGRIGTYEEYAKGSEVGKEQSRTEQKKVPIDLLEQAGVLATEKKKLRVDEMQEALQISKEEAEQVLEQLVALDVLKASEEGGTYETVMDKEAFQKKMQGYRVMFQRAEEVEHAKNPNLIDITISNTLVADKRKDAIKTRVPGTWGDRVRYLWTGIEDMAEINDGKTFLSTLDPEKEYKLYDDDDKVVQTISGQELYNAHYDPVAIAIRERYEKEQREEQKRQRQQEQKRGQGSGQRNGQHAEQHSRQSQQGQRQGGKPNGNTQGAKKKHPQNGQQGRTRSGTSQGSRRR